MSGKTYWKGKPASTEDLSLGYQPWQRQNMQQAGQMGMDMLKNPYQGFEPIRQQAQQNYAEQGIPLIMQRLTNMGLPMNGSGAFSKQLVMGQQGLDRDLAAQQAQFGQNNISNAMGLLDRGNTRMYETMYNPRQQGFGERIGRQFGENLGRTLTTNGPDWLSQLFGGGGAHNTFGGGQQGGQQGGSGMGMQGGQQNGGMQAVLRALAAAGMGV